MYQYSIGQKKQLHNADMDKATYNIRIIQEQSFAIGAADLFVDDGIEHDPGQPVVLEWRELGGLVEDEHCRHLSGCWEHQYVDAHYIYIHVATNYYLKLGIILLLKS